MLSNIFLPFLAVLSLARAQDAATMKENQLQDAMVNTMGQVETTAEGTDINTSYSVRAGPRGYVLLEDVGVRKKMLHFDRERAPERVVHALGHGAFGTFTPSADWSNLTSACWLQKNTTSEVFTRFSVVVASNGGSEVNRDTHGFATKIYSPCGNQDLVGNHLPSFFIQDGADFPDLIHAVKFEANKGFPTGGTAHTTAYDFFAQHPEGAFQLMNVLSDLGIPRDVRHMNGAGVHTYRFINDNGQSMLYKWYWNSTLGLRSLVYDEVQILAGKNGNFQRVDLFNNIAAGNFPSWDFNVQLFPDDGTYMWNGIDLLDATAVVPFEMNPPITLGRLTLNRNPTNFFAEPESISFAVSTVVKGINFTPDPLLQWRLMSYDDTSTHRHNSPNGYLLPINRAIAPVNNNYRDGYMQPLLFEGASISSPDGIGGVIPASPAQDLPVVGKTNTSPGTGSVGRYASFPKDPFGRARTFWAGLDIYSQQHTVDAYRFELGNVANKSVVQNYINTILNPIDNCLARRVAIGIGATPPALVAPITNTTTFPSQYTLTNNATKPLVGLAIGVLASDTMFTSADESAVMAALSAQNMTFDVIAPTIGPQATGVMATQSYITASETFYDAVIVGSTTTTSSNSTPAEDTLSFIQMAYVHGKAIGEFGSGQVLMAAGISPSNTAMGVYVGAASTVVQDVLTALAGPVRFPARYPVDPASYCM